MILNPIIIMAATGLFGVLVYAFLTSRSGVMQRRKKGYELERVDSISSLADLESLLGEDLTSRDETGILSLLPDNSERYVKRSSGSITEFRSMSLYGKVKDLMGLRLDKAHNVLVPWEYGLLFGLGFIAGTAFGLYIWFAWWSGLAGGIIGGLLLAESVLNSQAADYRDTVNKQAIALVQLVIQNLRGEASTAQAFEYSVADIGEPISKEMAGLARSVQGQVPIAVALKRALPETTSPFLKKVYKVVIMCSRNRMSPIQIADRLVITRRNLILEYSIKRQMRAAAGGSVVALTFLKYLVPGLLLFLIKKTPFILTPLINGPQGWMVSAAGIVLYLSGIYFSNKTLKTLEV